MTQSKKLVLHLAWFFVHVLIVQWLLYFVHPRQKGIFFLALKLEMGETKI